MNHLQAFRQHSWHSPGWRSHKIEILVDDIFSGNFSFQASSEQIEAAGGQEIQIEAVQVMVGHQKVSLDHMLYSFTLLSKVSAVDGYLQDIRVITANKELLSKVQT